MTPHAKPMKETPSENTPGETHYTKPRVNPPGLYPKTRLYEIMRENIPTQRTVFFFFNEYESKTKTKEDRQSTRKQRNCIRVDKRCIVKIIILIHTYSTQKQGRTLAKKILFLPQNFTLDRLIVRIDK